MASQSSNVLSEEFLMDLYYTCITDSYTLAAVATNIRKEDLPDRSFIKLHTCLTSYFKEYKQSPKFSIIKQMVANDQGAAHLLDDIFETTSEPESKQVLERLEDYIKRVRFQKAYKEAGEFYNRNDFEKASNVLQGYTQWSQGFDLTQSAFVDVISSFTTRFRENREDNNNRKNIPPITRFYIDELDSRNEGKDLRTQLTCLLASTGVGKSHIARWIGTNACMIDGLNVLHIQLEGSEKETVNAYSASLVSCNTFKYETGRIRDAEIEKYEEMLKSVSGKLYVRSYPKFNCNVSTIDIQNAIIDFKKRFDLRLDVVIIDSMDLLNDASGKQYGENGERRKRIAVADDLKDLASDENVWMVVTYQSTIENRDWINDEKNVLSEYNSSEAKGIARPMTHLITLNQSDRERKEETMRLFVAKSRFFAKGEPFRIATDYGHERFYDRQRTMNINLTKD